MASFIVEEQENSLMLWTLYFTQDFFSFIHGLRWAIYSLQQKEEEEKGSIMCVLLRILLSITPSQQLLL